MQPRWRLLPSLSHNDCHCNDLFINSTWDAFLGRNSLSDTSLPATSLRGKRVKSSTGLFKYSLTAYCWILCKICAVEFFSSPVGNKIFSQSDSGLLSVSQGWFSPLWWLTGSQWTKLGTDLNLYLAVCSVFFLRLHSHLWARNGSPGQLWRRGLRKTDTGKTDGSLLKRKIRFSIHRHRHPPHTSYCWRQGMIQSNEEY